MRDWPGSVLDCLIDDLTNPDDGLFDPYDDSLDSDDEKRVDRVIEVDDDTDPIEDCAS